MTDFAKSIELHYLPGHGWLASAHADGFEYLSDGFDYLGEYRPTAIEALVKAEAAMNRHEQNQKETA